MLVRIIFPCKRDTLKIILQFYLRELEFSLFSYPVRMCVRTYIRILIVWHGPIWGPVLTGRANHRNQVEFYMTEAVFIAFSLCVRAKEILIAFLSVFMWARKKTPCWLKRGIIFLIDSVCFHLKLCKFACIKKWISQSSSSSLASETAFLDDSDDETSIAGNSVLQDISHWKGHHLIDLHRKSNLNIVCYIV